MTTPTIDHELAQARIFQAALVELRRSGSSLYWKFMREPARYLTPAQQDALALDLDTRDRYDDSGGDPDWLGPTTNENDGDE